jgi:hypothetical protein
MGKKRDNTNLWDFGTKVRILEKSAFHYLDKYPASIVAFRWRKDGGVDYRVRAWRTNQHWIPEEDLEKTADAAFCSNCMKVMNHQCCGGCCV